MFIELRGVNGAVGKTALENAANNFERNRRDVFTVPGTDVGDLLEIDVWHGNNGVAFSDWHLAEVRHA